MTSSKYHIGGYYWSTTFHKTLILQKIEGTAFKFKDADGKDYQELNANTLIWVEKPIPASKPEPEQTSKITSGEPDVNGRMKRSDYGSKLHTALRKDAVIADSAFANIGVEMELSYYVGYNFMVGKREVSGLLLMHSAATYHKQIKAVQSFLKTTSKEKHKVTFKHFMDLSEQQIMVYLSQSLQAHCVECVDLNFEKGQLTIEDQDIFAKQAMQRDTDEVLNRSGSLRDIIEQVLKGT